MKIRRTLALVLAIVTAFSLAACGNAEPAGDDGSEAKTEIVAALNSVPGNLDISATMGVALLSVSPHIYDYLIDMDEDYNFIPAIATSWERVDDTTWTSPAILSPTATRWRWMTSFSRLTTSTTAPPWPPM